MEQVQRPGDASHFVRLQTVTRPLEARVGDMVRGGHCKLTCTQAPEVLRNVNAANGGIKIILIYGQIALAGGRIAAEGGLR